MASRRRNGHTSDTLRLRMRTTVKGLAEEIGADERTLRRAVQQGTVQCERVSPRRIEVSDAELAYLREHWPSLARLRAALRTEPNVRVAILFGSLARGDGGENSDVDLLVDLRDEDFPRPIRLIARLEDLMEREVQFIPLERVRHRNPLLLSDAVRDGRVIVDRVGARDEVRRQEPEIRIAAQAQDAREIAEARAALEELGAA
jgi:predicted nucleotidyltransferase